jgi:hypothetical protein
MTWELYEVWGEDDAGHQELIDTTQSLAEAKVIAETALEDVVVAIIYKERKDGELELVEEIQRT